MIRDPERLNQLDVDKFERLMELAQRHQQDEQRREFAEAMNRVQASITPVLKRGFNQHTRSHYAYLDDIMAMLMPILTDNGLSVAVGTERVESEDKSKYVLTVRHRSGGEEKFCMEAPADIAGIKGQVTKTMIHALGSTATYCSRYLICMVFFIPFARDDDGNLGGNIGPAAKPIDDKQVGLISQRGDAVHVDWAKFKAFFHIGSIEDLPLRRYAEALRRIDESAKARGIKS